MRGLQRPYDVTLYHRTSSGTEVTTTARVLATRPRRAVRSLGKSARSAVACRVYQDGQLVREWRRA